MRIVKLLKMVMCLELCKGCNKGEAHTNLMGKCVDCYLRLLNIDPSKFERKGLIRRFWRWLW